MVSRANNTSIIMIIIIIIFELGGTFPLHKYMPSIYHRMLAYTYHKSQNSKVGTYGGLLVEYWHSIDALIDQFDCFFLVNEIEDVRRVDQYTDCAGNDDRKEEVQL